MPSKTCTTLRCFWTRKKKACFLRERERREPPRPDKKGNLMSVLREIHIPLHHQFHWLRTSWGPSTIQGALADPVPDHPKREVPARRQTFLAPSGSRRTTTTKRISAEWGSAAQGLLPVPLVPTGQLQSSLPCRRVSSRKDCDEGWHTWS
jgi:hypothetical protein